VRSSPSSNDVPTPIGQSADRFDHAITDPLAGAAGSHSTRTDGPPVLVGVDLDKHGVTGKDGPRVSPRSSSRLSESAFLSRFQDLLAVEVAGIDAAEKARMLQTAAGSLERNGRPVECRIVPFVPGRRPAAEAAHPGLGSSEAVGLILPGGNEDPAWLLYTLEGDAEIRTRVSFTGPDGSIGPVPVPGWEDRPAVPNGGGHRALEIAPARDLLPGAGWAWAELDPRIRAGATDGEDPFTFGHLFSQQLLVELRALDGGVAVAGSQAPLLVCDVRRCGSLYARLLERLVAPDAERQAQAAGVTSPGAAYHPWYPVLRIGADKAALYMRALVQDIAGEGEHLSDPGWLVRVGLYLEFLTFLGIVEAVREEAGDLLSPAERAAFERDDCFQELRACIDPVRWREVWELRRIQFPRRATPRTGPVSVLNLLAKKKATLGFLHVHHADLQHAVRLAGVNHHNAQETWQRVFRDAERAVLRNVTAAFPELDAVSAASRDFILWHRKGRFERIRVPGTISGLFSDQDGLFGAACAQYRDSMNHVAAWAKGNGLMDYTGSECVPSQVSLLEAHVNQPARVALLQRHDGYGPELQVGAELPASYRRPAGEIEALLAAVPIFALLAEAELASLAQTARPLTLGPTERLVVQGQPGDSLFVLADGELEVLLRRDGGEDLVVDTLARGAVVGEMSLLTGEPRTATLRALDGAVAYEIGARQYAPLLRDNPDLLDLLADLMLTRIRDRGERLDAHEARTTIAARIRSTLFAPR
jgi:CRP-like cAMP-binding protein